MAAQLVDIANYLAVRVSASLKGKVDEKFKKNFELEDIRESILDFVMNPAVRFLVFLSSGSDKVTVQKTVPDNMAKKKGVYFLKAKHVQEVLNLDTLSNDLICAELSSSSLQSLSLLSHEVFFPLITNPANREEWSGPTSKEVISQMNLYLSTLYVTVGQSRGKTLLPLPPAEAFDVSNPEKERVYVLETSVKRWTDQIEIVLRTDPESMLRNGTNPGPMAEISFWTNKSHDLNSLHEQMQSAEMKRVIAVLQDLKSPAGQQLEKIGFVVLQASEEASQNTRFLKSLVPFFNQLTEELDFGKLEESFVPMMHTLLLIFMHSTTYNTRPRLTVLIQTICNALITQAQQNISGQMIFRYIEDENVTEAVRLLKMTIHTCDRFKEVFAQYREKANSCLKTRVWDAPKESLFVRLDTFLERCQDILEFTKIVQEFSKLEKVNLGGTKGKALTDTVRQVYIDFSKAVEQLKGLSYDIMDVTIPAFDDDFYKYRCQVKDLERRLASVLALAFEDAGTISARFKLLESFDGLLDRPIIKDELDKKQSVLLRGYTQDLLAVQELFHTFKEQPRIDNNMPPIAGALLWCRGLLDRVQEPMEKLRTFTMAMAGNGTAEREETKEIEKIHHSITQQLSAYEQRKIEEWKMEVDQTSEEKLKQPLLRRNDENRRLYVNFDNALVRLLREVKYFLVLNLPVHPTALTIFEQAETFRTQIGNLELIVNMYNEMMSNLHRVERPLVEKDMERIDQTLERGLNELNWKSEFVNEFIAGAMEIVSQVHNTVKVMKSNLDKIKKCMADFAASPMCDRKNKPLSPVDFEENLRKLAAIRLAELAKHQDLVTKLLNEVNEILKVPKTTPSWRTYVEFVEESIREGLASTIINSISFFCHQMDKANIEKEGLVPLLEIKLGLYANDVLFNADDNSGNSMLTDPSGPGVAPSALPVAQGFPPRTNKTRRDVWQTVMDWVNSFFEIGNVMRRQTGQSYVQDLKTDEGVVRCINKLKSLLDENFSECDSYRSEYTKFEFLWKSDRTREFEEFLSVSQLRRRKAVASAPADSGAAGNSGENTDEKEAPEVAGEQDLVQLPLVEFEGKVAHYKNLQSEVANKPTPIEKGWLKINAQPIKQALGTWVSRWIHTYTSYLYNHVTRKLNQLDTMIRDVNQGLTQDVPKGDSEKLKATLGFIHQVKSQEKNTVAMFQPLRDIVNVLKKHGKQLDDYELKLLSDAPMKWDATVNKVYKVKEQVNNLQNEEVDKIKSKVDAFERELEEFRRSFKDTAPFSYDVGVEPAYELIYQAHLEILEMEKKAEKLNDLEKVFELNVSKHRQIAQNRAENTMLKQVWDMVAVVKNQFEEWNRTLWDQIDTDQLLDACKKLQKQISVMPKDVRGWSVYEGLQAEVKNLITALPLVTLLHSPAMSDRHWRDLMTSTGKHFTMGADFCLKNLLELELHNFVSDVEDIVELANKESKIGNSLDKIEDTWKTLQLEFIFHKSLTGEDIKMIRATEEIMTALEENMAMLQAMQGMGKYIDHFVEQVTKWQKHLGTAETVLYNWLDVQSKWSSLQSIFLGSKDIRVQLPEDSQRFDEIHQSWKTLMKEASNSPNVIEACSHKSRSEALETMKVGLEQCEKSLNQYLETKRKAFPRFYFLSNAALLDILSNGHNPLSVQKHLGDCFDNIAKLTFDLSDPETKDHPHTALGMHSKEGEEYVDFIREFHCENAVEEWLGKLVVMMKDTLRDVLYKAKSSADHWEIEKPREKWLFDYPAQIALTASQLIWTEEVESTFEAFEDGNEQAMKDYLKTVIARLESLIQLVLGDLNKRDRVKIITLITVDVHNRDVVQKLIDGKVQESSAFAWQSQMRFEWQTEEKNCVVKVADARFDYSYEYIGNTGRLVITPLTDRCYITLTQALRLIMGGAPAGPAGTGKTETTKDLGRALGLPVYVFNCSEQMNVQSMGAVFKGLCQTGAWGCFDEFNRIPIEVLSVVSTQFACVLNAIREKRSEFDFMGEVVSLVPTIGAFITMNPGYAGRTELPENLKALFRSCAMVVPDMQLICENMLMSEGFLEAARLSKKFVTLYSLSSELLSKQMHYDWGLRATKAVLRVAGSLKRAESKVDEDRILMRALRDFNLPKLVDEDKPIFIQLVKDLFPGLGDTERKFDEHLHTAIQGAATAHGLQADDMFVRKCVELAELLEIRHSVFVIGAAGTGKSEIWKTLFRAFNKMEKKTVFDIINPKAVRNNELYGWLTKTDWHDGILSTVMRNMSRNNPPYNESQKLKVIVLDGDIDPEWIESLNTVMDDNKVLTLVSNERIPLTSPMRLLFEISNLDNATPATVSRAGILFINQKDIGSKPFLDSWIEKREDDKEKSSLLALFHKYCTPEYLNEMRKSFKRVVPISEICMIQTLCHLLEGLMVKMKTDKRKEESKGSNATMNVALEKEIFEANFVFAAIWAFGGALLVDKQQNHRKEFSDWWKRTFATIKFPKDGSVFDCFPAANGKMVTWDTVVPAYLPPEDAYLVTKVFVPTVETTRVTYLMDLLVKRRKPVLLVGTAGTGKTTIVREYLNSLDEGYAYSTINLNAYTDAKSLQRIMESSIDKRSGRTYGPEGTKKLIYFIDDLNMPYVDKYGTQSPSCLIRQHMDYEQWYDTTKLEKKDIQDVQYIACMNPTSGSFTVDERLMRNFATFACMLPSDTNLRTIYGSVLSRHLENFSEGVRGMQEDVMSATIALHQEVSHKFLPSTTKFHYQFNLRDLSAIFQGMCMSKPQLYTPGKFLNLWRHECARVLADRLISPADVDKYTEILENVSRKFYKDIPADSPEDDAAMQIAVSDGSSGEKKAEKKEEKKDEEKDSGRSTPVKESSLPILFTSFVHTAQGQPSYLPVRSDIALKSVLHSKLDEYNDSNPVMNLELFDMAMEHICRIARIIENPRGNALLVGVGGSGKQSLAKLASFICGYEIFQISVTQNYGINDLKADLQELYRKTGTKNAQVTFLLTDSQIVNDEWLVYINDLLSSGYIPDLFTSEDKDSIFASLKNEAKAAGIPDNRTAMQDFFISKVRSNLHVVLCFSPVGEAFRVRCRKFPGLINCTSINWFHPWPRNALVSVAHRFLRDVEHLDESIRMAVAEHMAEVHLTVNSASERYKEIERRYNYTTPKSFLELIAFYRVLLTKKHSHLQKQIERLEKGITTLQSTQKDVAALKEELQKTLVKVEEKKEAATVLIQKMGVEKGKVEEQQALAAAEAEKAKKVSDIANAFREECEKDLAAALPIMQKAQDAVQCLTKQSLTTLKSFANPPAMCLDVTKAVQILKDNETKNFSWNAAKKMMSNINEFMRELKELDATNIDADRVSRLKVILELPHFNFEAMESVSSAAANLCNWVINVVQYNQIYNEVAPKMAAQKKAAEDFKEAQDKLHVVEERVAQMVAKLKTLTDALTAAMDQKNQVEAEARKCTERLALAKRLVDGLADENERWGKSIEEFREQSKTLQGDVLLAAAFVSYIGAFNQQFRVNLWEKIWIPDLVERKIPITQGVDPFHVLADPSDCARWKNEGLPADRISLENGAIINQSTRWPLLIDPQLQGVKWIKNREKNLQIVQIGQKRWLQVIVQAVQTGQPALIENVGETLDASLEPILSRSIIKRGRSSFIKVGNEEVPYDPSFRLFLQTKLSNPHYKPEIAAQCTLINFIVTEEGLEEQLLALVVNREKPELEERRTGLVRAINQYMVTLTDLENQLLERLSNAPEDILSDVALIEGLEKTKVAATEIQKKVKDSREQEETINATRNEFRAVAAEGSWLYFLLIQLHVIDHMYQYSLDAFTTFFFKAMERATAAEITNERVAHLRESIRITIFQWVNRGLFEKHKLIFTNQLCFKLMQKGALAEQFNSKHYDFLIRAPKKFGVENPLDWLPDSSWYILQSLIELDGFEKLAADIIASPNRFKEWYGKSRPESTPLPLDWRKLDETSPFMKLLVVRAMRNDRMSSAMQEYVSNAIPKGKTFTECDAGKAFIDVLVSALSDSTPTTPIFFILSSGADPVSSVESIAKKKGMYEGKFHRVALGQGQDVVAMNRLDIGHAEGHWVVLENIHLMPSWTSELEKKLDDFAAAGSHPNFRVFLSAEPSHAIPIGLLERSIKLTNEPPQGLKANLKRAFASFDKDEFEFKDAKVKSILFGLCHFHSIIIERSKFGPKGWNRMYPFSTGDLMNSSTVLCNYLADTNDKIPWADLRYIFGEILYGGHITDDRDRLLCSTYLQFYMREELLDEMELFPFNEGYPEERFRAPTVLPYEEYATYIDQELTLATPVAFGLHPNAEIDVKTTQSEDLFKAIMDLQPRDSSSGGDERQTPQARVEALLESIQEKVRPIHFSLEDIAAAIVDDRGPYQNVFLQECDRMNILTSEISRALTELSLGLSGELQMSERMESLFQALFLGRVPPSFERLAYPTLRTLGSWMDNLVQRAAQLQAWADDPVNIPMVTQINYLFNPQSFLTAIMQTTAQKTQMELDKLVVQTDVTRKTVEQTDSHARDGAYVSGLFLEGARWNWNSGLLEESLPREMFCELPVVNCRAVLVDKLETTGVYQAPVYKTQRRGPTYVFTANLRSKLPAAKWVLAGAVLVMEIAD